VSQIEELNDFVDSLVDASGAPDGESLLTRIGELRATASERDRLLEALESILSMPELDSIVLPEEPGELYPDPVVVGLSFAQRPTSERIERLKHKIVLMRRRADALDARVGQTVQERDALKAELTHIKPMLDGNLVQQFKVFGANCDRAKAELADARSLLARCSTKRAIEMRRVYNLKRAVRKVAAERDALKARVAELESTPLHPAIALVVEAAHVLCDAIERGFASEVRPDIARANLRKAIESLPSPLPRVVTCGECNHSMVTSERHIHCGQWGRVFLKSDYCSSGNGDRSSVQPIVTCGTCRHASAGLVAPNVLRCKLRAFDTTPKGYCDKGEALP
jgi:hypothetical protein